MFERFTDEARRVVVLAQEEARMLDHNYIGTEHLLLGLIREGDGVAAKALGRLGIRLEVVRQQVEKIIGRGQQARSGHIPFTPRAKRILELSLREALQLGHNYIGTEHILLGLAREGEGVAAQVLVRLGADLNRVRRQVIEITSGTGLEATLMEARASRVASPWRLTEVMDHVRSIEQRLAAIERHLGLPAGEPSSLPDEQAARAADIDALLASQEPSSESKSPADPGSGGEADSGGTDGEAKSSGTDGRPDSGGTGGEADGTEEA